MPTAPCDFLAQHILIDLSLQRAVVAIPQTHAGPPAKKLITRHVTLPVALDAATQALLQPLPCAPATDRVVFETTIRAASRLPRSVTWVPITRNITAEDDKVLRACPHFGDDAEGIELAHFDILPGQIESEVLGEAEERTLVHLIQRHGLRAEVYSGLSRALKLSVSEIQKAYERVCDGPWFRQHM